MIEIVFLIGLFHVNFAWSVNLELTNLPSEINQIIEKFVLGGSLLPPKDNMSIIFANKYFYSRYLDLYRFSLAKFNGELFSEICPTLGKLVENYLYSYLTNIDLNFKESYIFTKGFLSDNIYNISRLVKYDYILDDNINIKNIKSWLDKAICYKVRHTINTYHGYNIYFNNLNIFTVLLFRNQELYKTLVNNFYSKNSLLRSEIFFTDTLGFYFSYTHIELALKTPNGNSSLVEYILLHDLNYFRKNQLSLDKYKNSLILSLLSIPLMLLNKQELTDYDNISLLTTNIELKNYILSLVELIKKYDLYPHPLLAIMFNNYFQEIPEINIPNNY